MDDTFAAAVRLAEGIELSPETRLEQCRRFEGVMTYRSVQVLYHLFGVARNTDQGAVGPVFSEHHMDEQHGWNLTEARLREAAQRGAEVLATETDIRLADANSLLLAALDYERESCCRTGMTTPDSFACPPEVLARPTNHENRRLGLALPRIRHARRRVVTVLSTAAKDLNPLVAETATAVLRAANKVKGTAVTAEPYLYDRQGGDAPRG